MTTTLESTPSLQLEQLQRLEERIAPLRLRLTEHLLYGKIRTPQDVRLFMESHVFAVWDFMSLLKALQARLTCIAVPWVPAQWPASRRFINEIVLGEESDVYDGRAVSHFELYLEAMEECGADTATIRRVISAVHPGDLSIASLDATLQELQVPAAALEFVSATFATIRDARLHCMAAAFTFGREDVIPDMFRELVRDLNAQQPGEFEKFLWYLERHIEVDGEDHGPLSLRMVADLCGDDPALWDDTATAAEAAITARLALWDGIATELQS